jgi:hypothetical protein
LDVGDVPVVQLKEMRRLGRFRGRIGDWGVPENALEINRVFIRAFWIGLLLFSIYLLSFSGKLHIMDEFVGFAVGNNLAQHGRADVNQFIWTNHWHTTPPGIWGKDHNLYTKKAPGVSLAALPLIWLGHKLPGLNAVHMGLLVSAIVTAMTGGLLFVWLDDLGISRLVASLAALSYGLCTLAWVYARFLWEHSIMALLFLTAMWALYRASEPDKGVQNVFWTPGGLWILLCSAGMAISLTMRFEAIFAVGLVGFYILLAIPSLEKLSLPTFWRSIWEKERWGGLAVYAILPGVTLLGLLYFNYARFGSVSETGYNQEILFQRPWEGSFGLLFSPSTGLFIYAPITLLIFLGARSVWGRLPRLYFWLIAGLTLFYWIFYGSWFSWGSTWVWGPRFMLHTLPLLMLFVAEPLERSLHKSVGWRPRLMVWGSAAILVLAGFIINFLGIVVDLNEHFLRLGRNDNFVFNWAAFPPLGHWRILQEGLTDLIWLSIQAEGLRIEWGALAPALALLIVATTGLIITYLNDEKLEMRNEKLEKYHTRSALRATHQVSNAKHSLLRFTFYVLRFLAQPVAVFFALVLTIILTYQMMLGTARVALENEQAQADQPLLELLTTATRPHDPLLISMPPFGDVQEISTHLMAYLDRPLPTYAWIESEPKAIQPGEREQLWQAVQAESGQVWLFERWLTQKDPLSQTAARFNQAAFPVQEWWFERSGKLTRYVLADEAQAVAAVPLNIPFQGGLTLVDFAVMEGQVRPGGIVKVRLTWRAEAPAQLAQAGLSEGRVVGFVHLVDKARSLAQQDRLLLDLYEIERSPLLPGQTVAQGYGLSVADGLAPGSYPLIGGLYLVSSGQRLQRADGSPDDFVYLTNVRVEWGD